MIFSKRLLLKNSNKLKKTSDHIFVLSNQNKDFIVHSYVLLRKKNYLQPCTTETMYAWSVTAVFSVTICPGSVNSVNHHVSSVY